MTESQSLVIDGLTRKVGESVTSGDVTVTVDSITVGSSQIWALLDVTGWDFDRDAQYSFDRMRAEIVPDPSGGQHGGAGYGLDSIGITREGAARMLLEFSATISTGNQLNRGDYALEIDLNDLIRRRTGGQRMRPCVKESGLSRFLWRQRACLLPSPSTEFKCCRITWSGIRLPAKMAAP